MTQTKNLKRMLELIGYTVRIGASFQVYQGINLIADENSEKDFVKTACVLLAAKNIVIAK